MSFIVCHYHEIALKGKNRKFFENKLVENIRTCLTSLDRTLISSKLRTCLTSLDRTLISSKFKKALPKASFGFVKRISGRIIIKLNDVGLKNKKIIENSLKNVFGMVSFSFTEACEPKIEIIKKKAFEMLKLKRFKTFRISAQRSDKRFPLTSQQINEKVGAFIVKNLKKDVKLEKPGINCFIEITEKQAFLYTKKIKGSGGLPVGTGGRAAVLLSGGIDSPVAAYLTIKRGVRVSFIHFHAHPYTGQASIEKVKSIVKILNKFQFNSRLYLVPFADVQKHILLKTSSKLRVILYRRFMLRIAEEIAKREKALALVTGDSIGQVASQTLSNIYVISKSTSLPVLRPLIGFDKEEIINLAKEIKTFDVSILPHQDCCARFLPRYPETKADFKKVELEEKKLNVKKLVEKAVKGSELLTISK